MNQIVKKELVTLGLLSMSAMPLDGKKPIMENWQNLSTSVLFKKIKSGQNFGIRTGKHSGCIVVDIDTKDRGMEIWTALEAKMGRINTYRVTTGSGGLHLYFDYKGTEGIKNGAKLVTYNGEKVGIDCKNDCGQVVAALSIHPDTKKMYTAEVPLEEYYKSRENKTMFEPLPTWLRELILGETVLSKDFNFEKMEKKAEKVKEETDPLVTAGVTLQFITQLVMNCIKPARADGYDEWKAICFGLSDAGVQYKLKTKDLAHEFSKQSESYKTKDGESAVNKLFRDKQEGTKTTLGTIRYYAKLDNPEMYKSLCADLAMPDVAPQTCWQDIAKIRTMKPTAVQLMMCFRGCIFAVLSSETQYFARQRDGAIEPIPNPFVKRGEDAAVPLAGDKSIKLREAFDELCSMPCWYAQNTFDRIDFIPSFTERIEIPRVLNLFVSYPSKPIAGSTPAVEKVLWHIEHILCNGNKEYYNMLTNWFAHLVQRPGKKIEILPMFLGEQGTGKSILFDKLFPLLIGEKHYHEIDDLNNLFDRFNLDQVGKQVCLLNEIGTYGKDHGQSGKMKSVMTRKTMKAQGKGTNKYEMPDHCNFILCTQKKNPVKVECSNRRYAAITASSEKIGDLEYFIELEAAITHDTVCRLLHQWLNVDISGWNKSKIPVTSALQYMKDVNLEVVPRFLLDIASLQTKLLVRGNLRRTTQDLHAAFVEWCHETGDLPKAVKVFSAELKDLKIPKVIITRAGERLNGFSISLADLRTSLRTILREPDRDFDMKDVEEVQEEVEEVEE